MIGKEYDLGEGKKVWWEMSERTTKKGPVDGAAVLAAFIDYESGQERIVLIANYRPPLDKFVIELPAGLVSPGEDPSIGAVRELKEETGYFARSEDVVSVTPVMHVDPWKSNEACVIVTVKLDMTLPENSNLTQDLDAAENIKVFTASTENLLQELTTLMETNGWLIDSKLYMYAYGLSLTKRSTS